MSRRLRYDSLLALSLSASLVLFGLRTWFSPVLEARSWLQPTLVILAAPLVVFWIWSLFAVARRSAPANRVWWWLGLLAAPWVVLPLVYRALMRPVV